MMLKNKELNFERDLIEKMKSYQDSTKVENSKEDIESYAKYLVLKSMKEDPKNDLFDKQPIGSMFHKAYVELQNNFGYEVAEYFSKHLTEVYEINFAKVFLVKNE